MKKMPLISVIVPIYKTEQYLKKCIDSILCQTYKEIELILVDDGSPDGCGRICDEYAEKDPRVVVIHQENTGQAGARNHGLQIARGDYIGFVDSDDWIAPEMYCELLHSLEENECDIAVCGRFMVRGDAVTASQGFNLPQETVMLTPEAMERFLTYQAIDSSCVDKLYKREILADVRFPLGYICEDVPFVYGALKKAKRVVHCGKPLYYVLLREGSTSRSTFNTRGMGLYYYFRDVSEQCKKDFPALETQAEYLLFKNLLVLACRIAQVKGFVPERATVNGQLRNNMKKILSNKLLHKRYKLFACCVALRVERLAITIAGWLGVRLA